MNQKRIYYLLIALILALASVITFPKETYACSCAFQASPLESMDRSVAVFKGLAVSVKPASLNLFRSTASPVKVSFQVDEVWKGHVTSQIAVETAESSASCGFEFQEGERYVVFAQSSASSLEVNACGGTLLQSLAGSQLTELGSGSIPVQLTERAEHAYGSKWLEMLPFLIVIGISGAAYFIYRKRLIAKSKT